MDIQPHPVSSALKDLVRSLIQIEVKKLEPEIRMLKGELANETDPTKRAILERRLREAREKTLTYLKYNQESNNEPG